MQGRCFLYKYYSRSPYLSFHPLARVYIYSPKACFSFALLDSNISNNISNNITNITYLMYRFLSPD